MKKHVVNIATGKSKTVPLTSEEEEARVAEEASFVPARNPWPPLQFMERFTKQERAAIRNAAKQSDDLADWLDLLVASTEVRADDQRTIAGMQALADAGLITAARRDEILA